MLFRVQSEGKSPWIAVDSPLKLKPEWRGCPRGLIVKMQYCGIVVSEFEHQLCNCVHFRTNAQGKGMNPFIDPPVMG